MNSPNVLLVVQFYYEKPELSNADIKELFSCGKSFAYYKKKAVRKIMEEKGITTWQPNTINTRLAFEVWGIDVEEYIERLKGMTAFYRLHNSYSAVTGK